MAWFKVPAMSQTFGAGSYPFTWLVSRGLGAHGDICASPQGRALRRRKDEELAGRCWCSAEAPRQTIDGKSRVLLALGRSRAPRDQELGREPLMEEKVNMENQDVGTEGTGHQRNEKN